MDRRIFEKIKTQVIILGYFLLFVAVGPIIGVVVCIPIYCIRFIVAMITKLFRPDLGKMITTRSAVIAAADNPSQNPKWCLCVWITLQDFTLQDFKQFRHNFLQNVVLKKNNSNNGFVSPEYQQYVSQFLGFSYWKWETSFDINEHMRLYDTEKVSTTEKELQEIIKQLTAKPFADGKSPWEFLFIPNFIGDVDDDDDNEQFNKSVLIFRVHHSFCDGWTILWLLLKELNKIGMDQVAKPQKVKKSLTRKLLDGAFFWIRAPYEFLDLMIKSKDENEWHLPQIQLTRPFNTAFTSRIPLSYIKKIKNKHGVSFTSVIMSAITGGLRKVMIQRGIKVPTKFSTAIAVPMPNHPEKLRNHFIFSFISLPVEIENPQKRLRKIEKNFQNIKRSPVTIFSFLIVPFFGGLFNFMIKWFSSNKYSTCLTSNFPGPSEQVYFIAGGGLHKVLDMNFSAGMGVGNVGIGFCMMSYAGGMRIITSVDKSILPTDDDVDDLNSKIIQELEILDNGLKTDKLE